METALFNSRSFTCSSRLRYRFAILPSLGWLAGWLAALALLWLVGAVYPASAEIAAEEGGGSLRWQSTNSGDFTAAVVQDTSIDINIAGMIAVVRMEQRFTNQTKSWQEGIYTFPLPSDAAVRRLEMEVGERRILGQVRERKEAAAVYQAAKDAGKKASLVVQQRPNLFSNRIANVGPGETVIVRLEYVQQANYENAEFSLRIPTTLTPRYIPGIYQKAAQDELTTAPNFETWPGWSLPTDQVPDAPAITPFLYPQAGSDAAPLNPVRFFVDLEPGMPLAEVDALYHRMHLSRDGDHYRLELADRVSEMDRDFELRWRPVTGSSPRAALFTEKVGEDYYGLLMVVPPALAKESAILPRDMIFVIDTSGSMGGEPIRQAKASLTKALEELRDGDRFNIIAFDSTARSLYRQPQIASDHRLVQAKEYIRHLGASGGTEMQSALALALHATDTAPDGDETPRLRQVVFITDGAVGNEQALFKYINDHLKQSRLFTVGIGSAPNQWFMQQAAAVGRGFSIQVTNAEEINEKVTGLYRRINAPLAANMHTAWPQTVEAWPANIPDLYRGEPLVQAVHFGQQLPAGEIEVEGMLAGKTWKQPVPIPDHAAQSSGVASLWARRKIAGLLASRTLGASEDSVWAQVLDVALTHQLLSPYTSFVAVEERISRPASVPLRQGVVPNTRPAGQSPQPYAYPATATTARANVLLGCMSLFVALLVYVLRRPEEDRPSRAG